MLMVLTAQQIREIRLSSGKSQKDFAEANGFSQEAVAKWELGQRHPRVPQYLKLVELYQEMARKRRRSRRCRPA